MFGAGALVARVVDLGRHQWKPITELLELGAIHDAHLVDGDADLPGGETSARHEAVQLGAHQPSDIESGVVRCGGHSPSLQAPA